jgi:hypothetical protein
MKQSPRAWRWSALWAPVLACAGGWAPQDLGPAGLERVGQGTADVGPLHQDLQELPLDLRVPLGFDAVYRGTATDPYGGTTPYFARVSGALTAVFPRSVYTDLGDGVRLAEVPPGTICYIGELPPELTGGDPALAEAMWSGVLRAPVFEASRSDHGTDMPFDPSLERMAAGRRAQIAAGLLRRAADADKARIDR